MGGIDWAGLDLYCLVHGIDDIEALYQRLLVIKSHEPPSKEE